MRSTGKKKNKTPALCWGILLLIWFTSCNKIPGNSYPLIVSEFPTATVEKTPVPSLTADLGGGVTQGVTTPEPSASIGEIAATVKVLPDPNLVSWHLVVAGLNSPVDVASAGDGSNRLFILERAGVIRIIHEGTLFSDSFLDLRDRVGSSSSEQGLLGLAFHPAFSRNGFFYVNYTNQEGNTVIARFSGSDDPNRAEVTSENQLLFIGQPYPNHNGGVVVFGPDRYLYLGLGDGGSAGDPQGNGQSTETLLGKILRIDIDGGSPYAFPPDNPFVSGGGKPEIWAYGLRNPWRISFDRFTGDLYIGDVGQDAWEEVDFLQSGSPGGANFGWNYCEGSYPYKGTPISRQGFVPPVFEYSHDQGCSVTGGVVYRGSSLPEWQGVYLFGDYCSGKIWGLLRYSDGTWAQSEMFEIGENINSFGEDESGEVYLVTMSGNLYRLER